MERLTPEISRSIEEADIADQQVGQMWIWGGGYPGLIFTDFRIFV